MKKLRSFLMCGLAIALGSAAGFAATLSGQVKDESNQPLANVKVVIPALNIGAQTDASGAYKIENVQPGNYVVEYRPLNYPLVTKNVDLSAGDKTQDVVVSGSPLALVPITISASPKPASTLTTPASVSVTQGRQLDEKRGESIMSSIQDDPGVNMIAEGPTVVKPVVNGLNSQDIVIAEDGVREDFVQWGNEHAPNIASGGADRIEVLRGANSLMYGSDAIGGVISVSHPELPNASLGAGPLSGKVSVDAHSVNNGVGENVELQGAQGDWGWRGNLSQETNGNFSTGNQGFIPNTGENDASGSGTLGVRKSWGDVQGSFEHYYKYVELQNGFVYPAPLLDTEYQVLRQDHATLKSNIFTDIGRIELIGGYDRTNRQEFNGTADATGVQQGSAGDLGSYWITTTYSAESRLHLEPMGPFNGTLGLTGLRRVEQDLQPGLQLTPSFNQDSFGEYLYEEAPVGDFTFNFGMRGDQDHYTIDTDPEVGQYAPLVGGNGDPSGPGVYGQELNYSAVTGAAGAVYHITEPMAFAVNAGRGYRNPIPFELFGDGVHEGAGVFQIGNPDLKPETSFNTDAELRWTSDRLKGEVGVFRNYIQDYIYGNYTGKWVPNYEVPGYNPAAPQACPPGTPGCLPVVQETQSNATLKGVDFTVSGLATDWLTLSGGGNLIRGYNNATGAGAPATSWVPEVPADNLRVGAEVHEKHLWGLSNPYFGVDEKFTNEQMRAAAFAIQTPGYVLTNLKIGTELLVMGNRITIDGGVNNLLNKGYIDFDSLLKEYNIEDPGRDVYVKVAVPFGS